MLEQKVSERLGRPAVSGPSASPRGPRELGAAVLNKAPRRKVARFRVRIDRTATKSETVSCSRLPQEGQLDGNHLFVHHHLSRLDDMFHHLHRQVPGGSWRSLSRRHDMVIHPW